MNNSLRNILQRFCILSFVLLGAPNLFAAVGFSISPSAVSNTYSGQISLVVTGLTAGASVVVQKFADYNTNGVIDASDGLVQQFTLTDGQAGMVIGGVTNINVPGDTDTTAGHITAVLNFQDDFIQTFVGKYLFKLSSPANQFTPITNSFSVTNFPFPQKFTGTVLNSGSAVPYSIVILFPPPRAGNHGPGNPQAGTIANSAGNYSIAMPPGTYTLIQFKTNFLCNFGTPPVLTLGSGASINTNLSFGATATETISGKLEDAANAAIGLPGVFVIAENQNTGLVGINFSDTNGNYSVGVNSGQWSLNNSSAGGLNLHGYIPLNNGMNVNATGGSVGGVVIPAPKATALFYGSVKDALGNPLTDVDVSSEDFETNGGNIYQADVYSDVNGDYVAPALAQTWSVNASDNETTVRYPNYLFSQGLQQNGGTNILTGEAVLYNFTAILATNLITGHVETSAGASITNVQVYASATINNLSYDNQVDTDTSGNYSLNVANGDWNVSPECMSEGNGDSLDELIGTNDYVCPNGNLITVSNSNAVDNISVQLCGAVQVITTNLPNGQVSIPYDTFLSASSCNGNFTWSTNAGESLPNGLTLQPSGEINGAPTIAGTNNFSVHVVDGNNDFTNQALSIIIAGAPLQIMTSSPLPNGGNGSFYSQTIPATGGQPPYGWTIPNYSVNPPPNLNLSPSGVLSGTLATNGTFNFYVRVTDATNGTFDQQFSLTITNLPLQVFTSQLPNATAGASYSTQLTATNGQPPYTWGYAPGSATLPANLTFSTSGVISGIPLTNGLFNFMVQVTDANSSTNTRVLGLIVNPKPSLSAASRASGGQFQMLLTGAANQGYTVQVSTNLTTANWSTLLVTNSSSSSFEITDPHATNAYRYYRVLIGP